MKKTKADLIPARKKKDAIGCSVNSDTDGVNFSTGREEFANCGILGICEAKVNGKIRVVVTQGCGANFVPRYDYDVGYFPNQLSKAEKRALVDWAIGMWKRWAGQ